MEFLEIKFLPDQFLKIRALIENCIVLRTFQIYNFEVIPLFEIGTIFHLFSLRNRLYSVM